MKFLFAILSLICIVLIHKSLAGPVNIKTIPVESIDPRGIFSGVNCLIHCVQPTAQESEDDDAQNRGIIGNFGTLLSCVSQCNA